MIVLHHIIGTLHADLFIKRDRVFIGDQVYRDILFTAGKFMCHLHQLRRDALPLKVPVYSQIRNIQPVTEIRKPEKDAYDKAVAIPGNQADGYVFDELWNPLGKAFLRILGTQIGSFQKFNVFFC